MKQPGCFEACDHIPHNGADKITRKIFVWRKSKRLRWSGGGILASVNQVRGFEPGRSHRIFQGEKILSIPSFGGEVKPSVPCRRFAACKRPLQVAWDSPFVGTITGNFSPIVPPFTARGHSRRCRRGGAWRCKWELPKPG
jgi:hypothetical protein